MRQFVFSDEFGNFDFSRNQGATKFFAVGSAVINGEDERKSIAADLHALKYRLLGSGQAVNGAFHCCEDRQAVRDEVFDCLLDHDFTVHVTALDKRKAQPHIRKDEPTFFQNAWWLHFNAIMWGAHGAEELVMITSELGTKKKRAAFSKAVSSVVEQKLPSKKRKEAFWRDESDAGLQVADYVLWAVMRKLERGDSRSYDLIKPKIGRVFQPFISGRREYY